MFQDNKCKSFSKSLKQQYRLSVLFLSMLIIYYIKGLRYYWLRKNPVQCEVQIKKTKFKSNLTKNSRLKDQNLPVGDFQYPLLRYTYCTWLLSHFTVPVRTKIVLIYDLLVSIWAPLRTFQGCKVRGGAHYHLSVSICENAYPFAHIPTTK